MRTDAHTGPGAGTDSYTYDAAGQTKTRIIAGGPNQTIGYTPDEKTASVSDTASNSASYAYDANGNLLLQGDTSAGHSTSLCTSRAVNNSRLPLQPTR